jgi:hypothetical protein
MGVGKRDLERWVGGKKVVFGGVEEGLGFGRQIKKNGGWASRVGGKSQPNFVNQGRPNKWQGYWGL